MKIPKLSIVILSHNTKQVLSDCLNSLSQVRGEVDFEAIVSDNGSTDGTIEAIKEKFDWVKLVDNDKNLGFAAGNNKAKPYTQGEYILFLNPDTIVPKSTLKETVKYLDDNSNLGALTCKIVLPNGKLDKDARRSFPTPWVALTHLILRLDRIVPHSRILAKYWYGYINEDTAHEVDALQGAFFLVRKRVLDEVGWFDEDYFLDGEDIDLCWRIKAAGWKIMYFPKVNITHIKGVSKGKGLHALSVEKDKRLHFRATGVSSMEIFYRKHMWEKYPLALNLLV